MSRREGRAFDNERWGSHAILSFSHLTSHNYVVALGSWAEKGGEKPQPSVVAGLSESIVERDRRCNNKNL